MWLAYFYMLKIASMSVWVACSMSLKGIPE
jgi:hypothetical protein